MREGRGVRLLCAIRRAGEELENGGADVPLSRRRTATGAGRSEAEAEALSLSLWGRVGMEKVCKVRDGGKEMRAVRVVWDGCRVCVWREDASHLRRDGDDFEIDVDGLEGACK
jgi:hypothetical protein